MTEPSSRPLRRPRSVSELRDCLARFSTPEGVARGLAFEPRPTDVFIATYPKSGTTLMQQIVHGLRTGGDLDFREITEVVPWIELAADLGIDADAEQRADPRAFKTHLGWEALPKGGRAIYLVRSPEAVIVSFYHFFEGWFFEPGSIDFETFALDYVLGREGAADYWQHLISWWPHRDDPDVLYLFYEDVVADLEAAVGRVANFIGLEPDPDRLSLAARQAQIDFMRQYPTLWDDNLLRERRNTAMGLPLEVGATKVSSGEDRAQRAEITPPVAQAWRARWAAIVEPVTGCSDYAALRSKVTA